MYTQVDDEWHTYKMPDGITDYIKDGNAITKENHFLVTKHGQKRQIHTTTGWQLLISWKDGTEQWVPLSHIKESNPVEVAEFADVRGIKDEHAFMWWVPYVLRKRDRIISAINSRVKNASQMPSSWKISIAFDIITEGK